MLRDQNFNVYSSIESFSSEKTTPAAFAGGTENARGDIDGTNNPFTLFRVTGDVLVRIFGVCTVNLVGNTATLEIGTANNTATLIAQTVAENLDAGEVWVDNTPKVEEVLLSEIPGPFVVVNSADIVETAANANITAGNIYYICLWRPLSRDGLVVAAN